MQASARTAAAATVPARGAAPTPQSQSQSQRSGRADAKMGVLLAWISALLCLLGAASALDNGLGKTPPLGWSSWNYFANHINESVILDMADAMVSTGLAEAGYEYINIDAGYLTRPRDASSRLRVNAAKFPSGIRHLADQIHAKGLKLGVNAYLKLAVNGIRAVYMRMTYLTGRGAGVH